MKRILTLIIALSTVLVTTSYAEPTGKDLIGYRESVMSAIGAHVGAIASMVRRKVDYDHMQPHAAALNETMSTIHDIFPAGSSQDAGETEALAAIWEDAEGFGEAVNASQEASAAFLAAVEAGDPADIGRAFGGLAGTCKGCHDDYRQAH